MGRNFQPCPGPMDPRLRGGDGWWDRRAGKPRTHTQEEPEHRRLRQSRAADPPPIVTPAQAGVHEAPGSCDDRGMKQPCVYILANGRNGTLYVGVTSDLPRRVWEHKNDLADGFTKRHGVHRLVHAEFHATMEAAIQREKRIKKWRRAWKIRLIEEANADWRDLYEELPH